MLLLFQLLSSNPHTVHFIRNLTVTPSWPTSTVPFPATARAFPLDVARPRSQDDFGTSSTGDAGCVAVPVAIAGFPSWVVPVVGMDSLAVASGVRVEGAPKR